MSNIFIQIGLSACVLIGPFLYLYLKSYKKDEKLNWAKHVISYLAAITILGFFYPYVEHRAIWSNWIVCAIYSQWFIYIVLSFKYLRPIFIKIKEKETLKRIDVWFLSIYFGVAFIWLAYSMAAYTSYIVGALSFTFILYLIVLLLIFRTNSESTFFNEKEKYKNKEIDKETLHLIDQKLLVIIEKELFLIQILALKKLLKN